MASFTNEVFFLCLWGTFGSGLVWSFNNDKDVVCTNTDAHYLITVKQIFLFLFFLNYMKAFFKFPVFIPLSFLKPKESHGTLRNF